MTDLPALIAKLEAATEGSRELSDEVLVACGWTRENIGHGKVAATGREFVVWQWTDPEGARRSPELDPTRSLDAAVAIVPDRWDYIAFTKRYTGKVSADVLLALSMHSNEGATPALALCISILHARAAS